MKRGSLLSVMVLATVLPGCKQIVDAILAEQAEESVNLTQSESALSSIAVDAYDGTGSATQAAQRAADRAANYYQPAGCLTTEVSGATVTYQLNDCTGPYGLVHLTGTATATFASSTGGIQADIAADDLKVNRATLDIDNHAVLTFAGADRVLDVNTNSTGVGPRGHSVTRDGGYTLRWSTEDECLAFDGDWTTQVDDGRNWTTTVSDWERCTTGCPKAGGHIEFAGGIRNVTVSIDYDGDDTASWESSRGSSGDIALTCVP